MINGKRFSVNQIYIDYLSTVKRDKSIFILWFSYYTLAQAKYFDITRLKMRIKGILNTTRLNIGINITSGYTNLLKVRNKSIDFVNKIGGGEEIITALFSL